MGSIPSLVARILTSTESIRVARRPSGRSTPPLCPVSTTISGTNLVQTAQGLVGNSLFEDMQLDDPKVDNEHVGIALPPLTR